MSEGHRHRLPLSWPLGGRGPARQRPPAVGPREARSSRPSVSFTVVARRSRQIAPEGGSSMATKITRDIIESYLNCKYKGHLKLTGESGTISDYEAMTSAARGSSREQALTRLAARFGEGPAGPGAVVTAALLKQGAPFLLDASLE